MQTCTQALHRGSSPKKPWIPVNVEVLLPARILPVAGLTKISEQIGKLSLSDFARPVIDGPRVGGIYIFTLAGVSSPVYLIYLFTSVTLLKNYYICICRIF